MTDSYRLRLGKATLVFFPPQVRADGRVLLEPHVVQVMMKTERYPTREEVKMYCDALDEITAAVEAILIEDLIAPLRSKIQIDGDGYVLTADKLEWQFGRCLELRWGNGAVRACAQKWVFRFRAGAGL
ncbi:hypothetical protein DFH07DRAFT_50122 [Mycena maculata]|uniref:Uncharacterized protein n=1 Tax=Mycena maculata TaxID=230809 RepID=A0AAD7IFL1_9AGAR|nr:hypothetical protein DFH07DRAFT_50122 [Mycena maculata]